MQWNVSKVPMLEFRIQTQLWNLENQDRKVIIVFPVLLKLNHRLKSYTLLCKKDFCKSLLQVAM